MTACAHLDRAVTAHVRSDTHPVVRSFEPGETWRWCYAAEVVA